MRSGSPANPTSGPGSRRWSTGGRAASGSCQGRCRGTAAAWAAEGAVFGGARGVRLGRVPADRGAVSGSRGRDRARIARPRGPVGPAGRRRGDGRPAGGDLDAVALAAPVPAHHHARGRGGRLRIRAGDRRRPGAADPVVDARAARAGAGFAHRRRTGRRSARDAPRGIRAPARAWRGRRRWLDVVAAQSCTWMRGR